MITNIFYTKVINDEDKEDEAPFVAPKARGGVRVVVDRCVEAIFEELVG